MTKTNKITAYCIKDNVNKNDILKEPMQSVELYGGTLYYKRKEVSSPSWVKDFFGDDHGIKNIFKVASAQAVYVKSIKIDNIEKNFAISFGTGHHLLNKSSIVSNFGLKAVLNIIDENNIKKIDTHNISSVPKHKSEQVTKLGDLQEFSLNYETDILMGISAGINKNKEPALYGIFGTNVTGKDSLAVNIKFDAGSIDDFLQKAYEFANSQQYKQKGFGWIDNIRRISKDDVLLSSLNEKLCADLKNLDEAEDKIWIAVPEIIKWEDIKGFRYKNIDNKELVQELSLKDLGQELSCDTLQKIRIQAIGAYKDEAIHDWSALECLYAETTLNNKIYMYINSNWYQIDSDFEKETENKFQQIINKPLPVVPWADYVGQNENDYNKELANNIKGAVCMDANNIPHGGGHSKIEFCDVFDIQNSNIIHVKKYAGSAVLSHLFNQGYVSATLLKNDKCFKNNVTAEIRKAIPDFEFTDQQYNIIYGILRKKTAGNSDNLPFFSKVTLISIASLINNMKGYEAFIKIIYTKQ